MQAVADRLNGQGDVLADLERVVRRNAEIPPQQASPSFHAFLSDAHGVIHVGAHTGQERDLYGDLPVAWIEPQDFAFKVLLEHLDDKPRQTAYQELIADGRCYDFGLASNAAQSSSIYDFAGHKKLWPEVGYIAKVAMQSITLRDFIERYSIDLDVYDTLVLDIQGAELLALRGAGQYLRRFRYIQAEAADFEAYVDGCQLADLDHFLGQHGFVREQLHCAKSAEGVGSYYDAVYRNRGIMPVAEQNGKATAPMNRLSESGHTPEGQPTRLNLGAGGTHLTGFTNVDRKLDTEVYPLPYPDDSIEEIVASHVLEHFSHRETSLVLQEWVRVLKPGGKVRLAVPDFEEVARLYLAGAAVNVQGYVMGGHCDSDDRHGCIFDKESLTELMMECGLERIGPWDTAAFGCAAGPHSLNLQGFKPSSTVKKITGLRACLSVPRFGPLMHPRCWDRAAFQLGLEGKSTSSCYWAQQISNLMEDAVADPACEVVLTMDFDTVFSPADVLELYRLLKANPEVDAVIPLQSKRNCGDILMSLPGREPGTVRGVISEADLARNLLPANTGHFGLTLFRADSLRKFPRPWMVPQPNAEGLWKAGSVDADIDFWKRFRAAGFKACLAPRVVVGHLEEVVKWPGRDLKPVYQTTGDYDEQGIPAEVQR
jgi:FkbM family methyltransferase